MNSIWKTTLSLVATMLVVLMPFANASAQPTAADQAFLSEVTGDEIDLGSSGNITFIEEDYDLRETISFQEEYIWFTYGWSNFQLVLIGGPNEAAEYHDITLGNMEVFYDSWELIDEEITDERSWFLGEGEISGGSLIVYYEFELDAYGDVDQAFMQFTDISTFQADLEAVQSEVTVGGEPLLPQTDAADLAAMIGQEDGTPDASPDADEGDVTETGRDRTSRGGTGLPADSDDDDDETNGVSRTSRGGTGAADDADDVDEDDDSATRTSRTSRSGTDEVDEDDDSTTRTSRTSRGGTDDVDETDAANDSETGSSSRVGRIGDRLNTPSDDEVESGSTPVSGADWDSMGLISDTEWESPTHGNVLTWDDAMWEFPLDYDAAIIVNQDPPYDIITLQTTDGLGYVYITVDVQYESTPSSLVEYWTSADYDAQITNGVTVIETGTTASSATMVYETTNTIDQPLMVVVEASFLDDGGIIFSQISAAPDTIHEVYEQFVDGVQYDDTAFDLTFTVEDIRDISGN